jgi:GntR family transcriptional regulator
MELKSRGIPLYYQLETIFRSKIASGEWSVGSKIPNEMELSNKYSVSIMTVKQALSMLVLEGLISRKRGKGTYVADKTDNKMIQPLEGSLTQAIGAISASTLMKVLDYKIINPPKQIANILKIDVNEPVLSFKRLYYFNSTSPFSLTVHYVRNEIGQYITEQELADTTPVTVLLDEKCAEGVGHATQVMRATIADDNLSALFSINIGFPILKVERTVFSTRNKPLQYADIYYRADKYVFRADLQFKKRQ